MVNIFKRTLYFIAILLITISVSSSVYGEDQNLFGPKKLTINRWRVHTSFHRFTVNDPGEGILSITKITPDKRLRGVFIVFNEEIIDLRDFSRGRDTAYEKTVSLRLKNRIMVFMWGRRGASISIEVRKKNVTPPPKVTFVAEPSSINLGKSSSLTWSTTDADSVSIDQGVGSVSLSGSLDVSPVETTTYTLIATGPGGETYVEVTVEVISAPFVTMSADPVTIETGGSSTLSWSAYNVDHAYIDNSIGDVSVEGSITVSPEHTTIYTLTAAGSLGSVLAVAKVAVTGNPELPPEGSYGDRYVDLIPRDATVEAYDSRRFSLITGLVQSSEEIPIADVSVTIFGHPEYGTVMTDARGDFSIPVEGGGTLTVAYEKSGLLSVQRKVHVPRNDNAVAPTIRMIGRDPASTTVTFDGNPGTVVTHRNTEVTDEFGGRSCTMVFQGDNRAYLVGKDGDDVYELSTITTRATEYTAPESMPAILPPTSAYTYCAELGVDGAQRVRFEKPVVTWVDNFLEFDVGEVVPVGYYDRDKGLWVPSDNGVVVKLLDTDADGIVDALDADGDDQPDDLNNDGSFSDEVTGLSDSGTYTPGATYWRVAVTHFTPWDFNWPFGPPPDSIAPNPKSMPHADVQRDKDCDTECGSYAENRSRIIHEDVALPGTDMTLHYAGNRVEGYKTVITVPASGDSVPASLKSIIVRVEIAGRTLEQILDPMPNQKAEIAWDGLDQLGRAVHGPVTAHVAVGFLYDLYYYRARSGFEQAFGQAGSEVTQVAGRRELISWMYNDLVIRKGTGIIAEGWTLSAHHLLSPVDPTILQKGDGSISTNNAVIIDTVAGTGTGGCTGDGGPAAETQLGIPWNVATDASGNLYIVDEGCSRIRKVDTGGVIITIAGTGSNGGYSGDGGPAVDARLYHPYDVTVDGSGNLFIADTGNHCIRKVDTDGIITTFAGDGSAGYSGDGGPAAGARLNGPNGVAVDASGNLYIVDGGNHRVRRVDTSGIITTVAGSGSRGYGGDGGPATEARLNYPFGIAVDRRGNLFVTDKWNCRVRKVDTSGIITTIAGIGSGGYSGDGGSATEARLYFPVGITVDAAGNLYIADSSNSRIRKVDTYGIITTVTGNGNGDYSGDGGPAVRAEICRPYGVSVDAVGSIYIADSYNYRVRKVGVPAALSSVMAGGDIPFVEENGLGYIMASSGRHRETIDLDTGVTLYGFGYDENDNLVYIRDRFGSQTTIQRDGSGVPMSITSPDGIVTYLTIDADNHLTRITHADGNHYDFEYTSDGLLTARVEPEGNRFEHRYSELGRLTEAADEEGGLWQYTRTAYEDGEILTEVTTGEGNHTTYLDFTDTTGRYTSTITDPTGVETLYEQSADGLTVNKSLACGMNLEFTYDLDPEYRFSTVKQMEETTPASRRRVTERKKTYYDTNSDGIPDSTTETVAVNGKETTLEHVVLQSTKIVTSPEGRTVTSYYNSENLLPTLLSVPGLHETAYGYDTRGRLTSLIAGTRETLFAYNADGFLESVTDPENHTTSFAYDPVGRLTGIDRSDGSSVGFTYDGNGNMTVLTTPSGIDHRFGYSRVNRNNAYGTPLSGSYSYVYDKDRRLTQINFPSGNRINNVYDKTKLLQMQTPEGNIDLTFLCNNRMGSITNGTDTIAYGYDGKLVTSETVSGTLNTSLSYSYDNDFNLSGFTYGGDTESYTYDNDGLLTGGGRFIIGRNTENGLPESVTGGSFALNRGFNGYGEVVGQTYTINSQVITSWDLTRDDNGRITEKTNTADGTTSRYVYTYDSVGRLRTVARGGTLVEEYRYDLNGTRNYEMNTLRGIASRTFTYSDEDHLLTAGTATYQYTVDGFLTTKTDRTEETRYDYSSRGELLGVTLLDGTTIDYIHDPLGRRIAKKVNGTITEKYLWQGLTRLLAVYDGSDNLKMRFEYADGRMPYAMTTGGSAYYLTCDQVGSIRIVADAAGAVVKQIDYDSFGNIITDTNPAFAIPFGFAGGLHDRDTGLVRFGVRDYDPDIGRWTAKDPILFNGGDTDLYGYCLNDPVNLVDAIGLWKLSFQGYWGLGVGISVGVNPNKLPFITGRVGYGFGGGVSFDPLGTSPGYDPCAAAGSINVGGFCEIGSGIYTLSGSLNAEGGYLFTPGGEDDHPFLGIGRKLGFSSSWRFSIGGGAGLEIGLVG